MMLVRIILYSSLFRERKEETADISVEVLRGQSTKMSVVEGFFPIGLLSVGTADCKSSPRGDGGAEKNREVRT